MSVERIQNPLPGEGLVAIQPTIAPVADSGWHRRLNLFSGRTLTAPALTAEQNGRAGRLASSGQARSPGIVFGLEATLQQDTTDGPHLLQLMPGLGITTSGEDVLVSRTLRVALDDLPTSVPSALLFNVGDGTPAARQIGPAWRQLRDGGVNAPPVGVVVLQPVVADMVGEVTVDDGCDHDPSQDAFDDWQIADACRLVLFTWPSEWANLPADSGSSWQNVVAHTIFEAERAASPPPWLELGVPLCAIGFDASLKVPRFADRYSVVRAGGVSPARTPLVPGTGDPFVWQSRLQQFTAQLTAANADWPVLFQFLPPAGLLPKDALQLVDGWGSGFRTNLFPARTQMFAAPVPLEQLEAVVSASASLSAYDLTALEPVQMLVPVPEQWFEPRLLLSETVDPLFDQTIQDFTAQRSTVLQRRARVRDWASALTKSIYGRQLAFPDPDPDRLEPETVGTGALDPTEESLLTPVVDSAVWQQVNPAQPLAHLVAYLAGHTPLTGDERGQLDQLGLLEFIALLENKVRKANDTIDFGFVRVQTDIYRTRQVLLGSTEASRLATSPALAQIITGQTAAATTEAINSFLASARQTAHGGASLPGIVDGAAAVDGPAAAAAAPVDAAAEAMAGFAATPQAANTVFLSTEFQPPAAATPFQLLAQDASAFPSSQPNLFANLAATPIDIQQQLPIIGQGMDFRTVSIAERIKTPPANEAKVYSVASKADVYGSLAGLDLSIDDLVVPGFVDPNKKPTSFDFKTIKSNGLVDQIKGRAHDPDPPDGDESAWLAAGINSLEATISTLRVVEGRVHAYQRAITVCRGTLSALQQLSGQLDRRLKTLGDDLARRRHDVAVARALLADEVARVDAVNTRRQQVFNEHVSFVAFHRPRTTDLLTYRAGHGDVPARAIDPGVADLAAPACLAHDVPMPREVRALVDLLRDAPVTWFTHVPTLLGRLDRLDVLLGTLQGARLRAQTRSTTNMLATASPVFANPQSSMLAQAMSNVFTAQQQVVSGLRMATAQIDLSAIASLSWQTARDQAEQHLSLGDLMDGSHGHGDVAQAAATELDSIGRVAACLVADFRDVLPGTRLLWAERLSQYEAPVDLHSLASLPRWGSIDAVDRRTMQALVDWLYGRVDQRRADAVAMMNDLLRLCILVASHAPVDEIVAGHVPHPTVIHPGGRVNLAVETASVRVGMHVLLYGGASGNDVVAHGVVEDLTAGAAAARVVNAVGGTVQLAQDARARFVEPAGPQGFPVPLMRA